MAVGFPKWLFPEIKPWIRDRSLHNSITEVTRTANFWSPSAQLHGRSISGVWFGVLGFNASATARVISRRWNDDEISLFQSISGEIYMQSFYHHRVINSVVVTMIVQNCGCYDTGSSSLSFWLPGMGSMNTTISLGVTTRLGTVRTVWVNGHAVTHFGILDLLAADTKLIYFVPPYDRTLIPMFVVGNT